MVLLSVFVFQSRLRLWTFAAEIRVSSLCHPSRWGLKLSVVHSGVEEDCASTLAAQLARTQANMRRLISRRYYPPTRPLSRPLRPFGKIEAVPATTVHSDVQSALGEYAIRDLSHVLTPALAIYRGNVAHNIDTTIALLGNDPNRWRPHLKTSKLSYVMGMLRARGVNAVKCATTLELLAACEAGFEDVLLAYPVAGGNAQRTAEIARAFPHVAVSVLVDSLSQIHPWSGSGVGVFLDIDPGMGRTGIPQNDEELIVRLAQYLTESGIRFRGLHYYDGHLRDADLEIRTRKAHAGYDRLLEIVSLLESKGINVGEVIAGGTPVLPCVLSYPGFRTARFIQRVSPGTVVYCDNDTLSVLPSSFGYRPAALVLSRVVSTSVAGRIACDAGHKAVSVDAGVPNCVLLGWDDLLPLHPSEEHLPVSIPAGAAAPALGEIVYLVPKHVCPTVNNFSQALIVEDGKLIGVEAVSARGREGPIWKPQ
jgi:D-serine deaminase-like pyridoxal phosphate-dependent protein